MKAKLKIGLVFVGALFLGAIAMAIFMGINTQRVMAIYADAQLQEMAINAHLIRAGKTAGLLERYDVAIPHNTVQFAACHRRYAQGNAALWAVERYYESNPSVPVPAEIVPILDALPPGPPTSCELKQRADEPAAPAEANAE